MDVLQTILVVINVIAVLLAPVMAVGTGRLMQSLADKRKDKMDIFSTLLAERSGMITEATAKAHNMVLFVFADSKTVCDAWTNWYDLSNSEQTDPNEIQNAYNAILAAMAAAVGYRKNTEGILARPTKQGSQRPAT